MADLQPLRALRHDPDRIPSLGAVIAPPYDVSDPVLRARLLARTPLNIIAADLADDPDAALGERYRHSAQLLEQWLADGVLIRDAGPALWLLEQRFPGQDGAQVARRGLFARVGVTPYGPGLIRPHERTHPAAVEDRLALTRATQTNLSPVFSLYDDPAGDVTALLAPAFAAAPLAVATDDEGTEHRVWRVGDDKLITALQAAFGGRELLIADGHHRYEAARRHDANCGGAGADPAAGHRFTLMLLVAAQDAGLVVQSTHRLVRDLAGESAKQEALAGALREHFDIAPIAHAELRPPAGSGPMQLGYIDSHLKRAFRCTLKSQASADAAMPGLPEAYRRLDTAILQSLVLEGALGLTQQRIDALDDLGYSRSDAEALELVLDGTFDCAFFLRPSPVAQVRAVAAAGVNMPAKSTSFSPKVPTGLLLSPLR